MVQITRLGRDARRLYEERYAAWLSEIMQDFNHDLASFLQLLRKFCELESSVSTGPNPILMVLEDAVEILSRGDYLYSDVRIVGDSWRRKKVLVEYVYSSSGEISKAVVYFSIHRLPRDLRAIFEYSGDGSVVIYNNKVQIVTGSRPYFVPDVLLTQDRLREFFSYKDQVRRLLRDSAIDKGLNAEDLQLVNDDREQIRNCYERVVNNNGPFPNISRDSHPFVGPILHVLPRLLLPRQNESILSLLCESLTQVASSGFESIMLGVVDRQSTDIFYGEDEHGLITAFFNNHGYWSSGEVDIDPLIGTFDDYVNLVHHARSLGLSVIQDTVLSSLGYPAQLPDFCPHEVKDLPRLFVGNESVDLAEKGMFLHESVVPEEHALAEDVPSEWYAEIIAQSHLGAPFALPKPNLFRAEVLDATLMRPVRQIRDADVMAFRIDMAKHIGFSQLQEIIKRLRNAAISKRSGNGRSFRILLEYWTTRYRDLKVASVALDYENDDVYFLDYPLAQTLQDIVVRNNDMFALVDKLLEGRRRWGISSHQLIPVFIDHDFSFKPIYCGSTRSRALTVFGYALCLILSSNGPYVYFGYDKAEHGVADLHKFDDHSEAFSRKMVREMIATDDDQSPSQVISDLFTALKSCGISQVSDIDIFVSNGSENDLTVRKLEPSGDGIEAIFLRNGLVAQDDLNSDLLFFHNGPPSVIIKKYRAEG